MVRKWSYLINFNSNLNLDNPNKVAPLHTLKVFKATTRLKKFTTGVTNIVRKNYAKRRHKTNWAGLAKVTRYWVMFFVLNKQFVRFYQTLGLVRHQSYSISTNFFLKQHDLLSTDSGFSVFSCSKKVLGYFLNSGINTCYKSPIPNNGTAGLLAGSSTMLQDLPEINPGLLTFDRLLYPYTQILPTKQDNQTLIANFDNIFLRVILRFIVIIYSLLIQYTLLTVHNFN